MRRLLEQDNKLRMAPTPIVFFDAMNDVDTWENKEKERVEGKFRKVKCNRH